MKPIDVVNNLLKEEKEDRKCVHCYSSPPRWQNRCFCLHNDMTRSMGVFNLLDASWSGVTESCTKEDWERCSLKMTNKKEES